MQIKLHPKQYKCLLSSATEILYGGAAGGGKSYTMRVIAITLCYDIPGLQVYLFRRKYPDLIANHMNGSGSFIELLGDWITKGICKIRAENEIIFKNGSKIHLCHCQHEKDVINYQGAEIHVLLLDELTHFTEYQYRFLRNRVRLGGLQIPERWKAKLPMILAGSNPGSVGHQWVKRTFINYAPPFEIVRAPAKEGGMLRQYIPARMDDNPTLMKNDPGYADRLEGLGNESLVKAMKDGDWDITAGSALEKLSRGVHMVRPFEIPAHYTKFTSMDWGTAKPYSVGWYAVADDDLVLAARDDWQEKLIPKGSIIKYRELYGWNGTPDKGCREESWQVAQKIAAIESGCLEHIADIEKGISRAKEIKAHREALKRAKGRIEKIDYRIADSAIWAEHDGPSIAENMTKAFVECGMDTSSMEKSRKGRPENYQEFRNRISAAFNDEASFYIFSTCEHFWRTIPELQLDERDPEKGPDDRQEDHVYDETGYALVSRPMIWTAKQRNKLAYEEAKEKAFEADKGNKSSSRY